MHMYELECDRIYLDIAYTATAYLIGLKEPGYGYTNYRPRTYMPSRGGNGLVRERLLCCPSQNRKATAILVLCLHFRGGCSTHVHYLDLHHAITYAFSPIKVDKNLGDERGYSLALVAGRPGTTCTLCAL